MKKLRNIDVSGYEAEEFDKWLEESTNKILKRTPKVRRTWEADAPGPLKASRHGQSKSSSYSRQRSI
jgi:formylglycine-generating enzyme required for sulfatase activity